MKIGILTFHNIPNIGALLQAQSLCQFLRQLGYGCDIIDYRCENIVKRELQFHPSDNFLRNLLLRFAWRKNEKKIVSCMEYMKQLKLCSKDGYDKNNRLFLNDIYDVFISGSDMIWNLKVTDNDLTYFLDFTDEDKVRLSYASSIGDTWTKEELDLVKPLLKRYNSVSVRESDTCSLLKSKGIDCCHSFDPTILIPSERWIEIAKKPSLSKYVLVYFPSSYLLTVAKQYAYKHNKKVVVISQGVPNLGIIKVSPLNPPEWLGLLLFADAVFTNSFHGVLFSLYFEKDVWTSNHNNRIVSLLEDLGIKGCLLNNKDDVLDFKINYSDCRQRLSVLRAQSSNYLVETLGRLKL